MGIKRWGHVKSHKSMTKEWASWKQIFGKWANIILFVLKLIISVFKHPSFPGGVQAYFSWFVSSKNIFSCFLFRWDEDGSSPLSCTRACEIVLSTSVSIGFPSLHGLRTESATAAANAWVTDRLFKRHGHWKSVILLSVFHIHIYKNMHESVCFSNTFYKEYA